MNLATAPRERSKIRIRRTISFGYRGTKFLLRSLSREKAKVIRHAICYPAVKDAVSLADLANRISWYLPTSSFSQPTVSIIVDTKLLGTDLKSLVPPASQNNYIHQSQNIRLVGRREVKLSEVDAILVWDKTSMLSPHILRHLTKVEIIDPGFYSMVESATFRRLYIRTVDSAERERLLELSRRNYQALLDEASGYSKAYVFGTGPSLDLASEFDYSGGFRVVCNSIVKNKTLLRHIKPHLLTFADPVFHFSPCHYSAEFGRMVLETVEEFQCYVMLPYFNVPLYLAHYPELESKVIGMGMPMHWMPVQWMPTHVKEYNFPTPERFYVRASGSIMTLFMLPVVSSVSKEIFIIGADGRQPDESYFWRHSPSSQFDDLMQTVVDTHPSFFRDRVYTDSYVEHCKFLEALIHYGESLGKRYYTLTPSYIPVLAQRPASQRKESMA